MARKKRIVLIESSNGHRKLLSFNLEIYLGVDVIFKNNADMLINLLKRDSDIQLIISEESVGSEQTILKIYYYITSANLNIPIILSGNCKKLMGKIEMYERKDWRKIIKKSANILGVTAKDMAKKEYEKYYPISTDMLLVMTRAPVDIFVSEGSHKFNVLFPAGKEIEQKAVRKHFLDLEKYLFVLSQERLRFANSFSEQIFDFIAKKNISVEYRIKATGMAFERAHEVITRVGMSEQAIKMAKATVESLVQIAACSHGLSDLMDILYDKEESYLYRHCLLIAIISHQIIGDMGWGNEEQKFKVAFAAFFHDITIPEEKYCYIHSKEELDASGLSEIDKLSVLRHAFNAAKLVENVPDIPFGVDTIIIQHHGALNGVGFKREEQEGRLSTLSTVFLVVEDYIDSLLDMGRESFDHDRVLESLGGIHSRGNFAKVVAAINHLKNA